MKQYRSIFREDLFSGQTILITGGGTGIGRAIAHELASLGAHVIIAARKRERLEQTAAEIEAAGGKCAHYTVNIRSEEAINAMFDELLSEHETIHGLVNNAGGQFPSPAENINQKGWHAVTETNLTGTFLMSKTAYNRALKSSHGSIVNIVAEMWNGFPGMAHTGAARAGVVNLTKSLAIEWAKDGVRINAVAPGVIHGHGITQYDAAFVEGFLKEAKKDIPARRLGTESEIAAAVTFLLSPAAAYITGETIKVDGGSSLWRKTWHIPEHDNFDSYDGFIEQPVD